MAHIATAMEEQVEEAHHHNLVNYKHGHALPLHAYFRDDLRSDFARNMVTFHEPTENIYA